MQRLWLWICLATFLLPFSSFADDNTRYLPNVDPEPPHIGNFALTYSQQPGAFLSFGQNVITKNTSQLLVFTSDLIGVGQRYVTVTPSYLYGLTENLSILLNAPIATNYQSGSAHSAGFGDAYAQMEYAYFNKQTGSYFDQATVLGAVIVPTGSNEKNPITGLGSPSFFVGTTFDRTYVYWFFFTSYGATFTTANQGVKYGNVYYYQGGVGKTVANVGQWLFAWVLEGNGQWVQRDQVHGALSPNSGGNIIYVTPSLWISSKHLLFQLGAGYPAAQHLYGDQKRLTCLVAGNFGLTF